MAERLGVGHCRLASLMQSNLADCADGMAARTMAMMLTSLAAAGPAASEKEGRDLGDDVQDAFDDDLDTAKGMARLFAEVRCWAALCCGAMLPCGLAVTLPRCCAAVLRCAAQHKHCQHEHCHHEHATLAATTPAAHRLPCCLQVGEAYIQLIAAALPEVAAPTEALLEVAAFPDDGICAICFNFWHKLARQLVIEFQAPNGGSGMTVDAGGGEGGRPGGPGGCI
jgi:hypothetical protein